VAAAAAADHRPAVLEPPGAGAATPDAGATGATVAAIAGVHQERIFFTYPIVSP
jgi:hypothetical protein